MNICHWIKAIMISLLLAISIKSNANHTCTVCGKPETECSCPKAEALETQSLTATINMGESLADMGHGFYQSLSSTPIIPLPGQFAIGLALEQLHDPDPMEGYLNAMGATVVDDYESFGINGNFVFAIQDTETVQGDIQTLEFLQATTYEGPATIDLNHHFLPDQYVDLGQQIRKWIQENLILKKNSYHFVYFETNDCLVVKYGIYISKDGGIFFIAKSGIHQFQEPGTLCTHLHAMFYRFKIRQIRYLAKVFQNKESRSRKSGSK